VARHLPHDTARNARFFIGIVNAAKMEILSAGQHQVAVAFGAGAGDPVELHVVVDGQADDGRLGNVERHHQAGVGRGRPAARHQSWVHVLFTFL
jgi:hypothetical protein